MKKLLFLCAVLPVWIAGGAFAASAETREVDVVWSTSDGSRTEIFYTNQLDGKWSEPTQITDDYYDNMYPVVDRDQSGSPWVFWTAYSGGSMELRYAIAENGAWQDSETLASELKTNVAPSVIIDDEDVVWVVWSANNGGLDDIYFASSKNDTWTEPARVHPENTVADMLPEIGKDGTGSLAVSWQRLQDGEPVMLMSTFNDGEWSDAAVPEVEETESAEEIVELPDFIKNTSMVFVRIY